MKSVEAVRRAELRRRKRRQLGVVSGSADTASLNALHGSSSLRPQLPHRKATLLQHAELLRSADECGHDG